MYSSKTHEKTITLCMVCVSLIPPQFVTACSVIRPQLDLEFDSEILKVTDELGLVG